MGGFQKPDIGIYQGADSLPNFVDGALGTMEAAAIVDNVVSKIGSHDGDIFVTYDTHFENYMDTAEGKKLPVPHCIKGTEGWKLNSRVQAALEGREYTAVEKPTFGATELVREIKQKYDPLEIEIELIGLCTDICVVSNALLLKANFPETAISVDSACCAGVTPETHEAALATMRCCQIDIK